MIFLTNPLHFALHHDLRWRLATRYAFAADQQAISLARSEIAALSRHLLIAVQTMGGRTQVVAVIKSSLYDSSLVTSEGAWREGPVPLALRYHPFSVVQDGQSPGRLVLGVVADPDCLSNEDGEPFFDHLARPLPRVTAIQRRLIQIANEKKQVNLAAEKLHDFGALTPIDLPDRGRTLYYTVNIESLANLKASVFRKDTARPQDILHLAAALDASASIHFNKEQPARPSLWPTGASANQSNSGKASQPSIQGSFLIDDDLEMRF